MCDATWWNSAEGYDCMIFFNIFGGITRCDDVANGILQAKKTLNIKQPIVARLTGTNEEKAMEILKEAGLIFTQTMDEGAKKAIELLKKAIDQAPTTKTTSTNR